MGVGWSGVVVMVGGGVQFDWLINYLFQEWLLTHTLNSKFDWQINYVCSWNGG